MCGELEFVFNKMVKKLKVLSFRPKQQQQFLEDLSELVLDGVPMRRAVDIIANTATDITKEVAEDILVAFGQGKLLAECLQGWLSNQIAEIIRAGEEGGTLSEALKAAAETLERQNNAVATLLSSITYPLVVLAAGLAVAIFINHSIFTSFRSIMPMNLWPPVGQDVAAMANFVQHWWFVVLLGVIAVIIAVAYMLENYVGEFRNTIDNIPLLNLYRKQNSARLMQSLGMLMLNGVVFKKAIKILQYSANPYLSWHLFSIEHRLGTGQENIADVLDTGLIDKHDLMRLRIVAHGRGFEHAVKRQGERAQKQSDLMILRAARILGGVLLVCGAMLAIFMILGVYNVGSAISTY